MTLALMLASKRLIALLLAGCGGTVVCTPDNVCVEVAPEDAKCTVSYCNKWTSPEHVVCKEWKTQKTWCRQ